MDEAHEAHLHLLVCIDRLNDAWRTLKLVESHPGHPLEGPAFRYALVEYATAFTRSDSTSGKKRRLQDSHVPDAYKDLHNRIMAARNSLHAHADVKALEARLHITKINGQTAVSRVENYVHGCEELPNLQAIVSLVEGVLSRLYEVQAPAEKDIAA